MISEAMKTGIDGVFLDGPVFFPDSCHCDACKAQFKARYGAEIPKVEDWSDPNWLSFVEFRNQSLARFLADSRAAVKSVNPEGVVSSTREVGRRTRGGSRAGSTRWGRSRTSTARRRFSTPARATTPCSRGPRRRSIWSRAASRRWCSATRRWAPGTTFRCRNTRGVGGRADGCVWGQPVDRGFRLRARSQPRLRHRAYQRHPGLPELK